MTKPLTFEDKQLLLRLREPVDEGGYDGRHPDSLHISAANRIEELIKWLDTEKAQHQAWRKRGEEAEVKMAACAKIRASVECHTGRLCLMLNGIVVAVEGDDCRDAIFDQRRWDEATLKEAAKKINANPGAPLIAELTKLREVVKAGDELATSVAYTLGVLSEVSAYAEVRRRLWDSLETFNNLAAKSAMEVKP